MRIALIFILMSFFGCRTINCIDQKPLETIIKFHSILERNITKDSIVSIYFDVKEVYKNKINDSIDAFQLWKNQVESFSKLPKNKFSRSYNYYLYDIIQYASEDSVIVEFKKDSYSDKYYLVKRNENWVIVKRNGNGW